MGVGTDRNIVFHSQISIPIDPRTNSEAATKKYVDDTTSAIIPMLGDVGQVLTKKYDGYNQVEWKDVPQELPNGGTAGQILAKASNTDKDVTWVSPTAGGAGELPTGGTTGQVLAKASNTDKDVAWVSPSGGTTLVGNSVLYGNDDQGDPTTYPLYAPTIFAALTKETGNVILGLKGYHGEVLDNTVISVMLSSVNGANTYASYIELDNEIYRWQFPYTYDTYIGDSINIKVSKGSSLIFSELVHFISSDSIIPVGGTSGQVLTKASSTDRDVEWVTPSSGGSGDSFPAGGSTGQALVKNSNTDKDVKWATIDQELPSGGSSGQVLAKASSLDGDVGWVTPSSGSGDSFPAGGTTGQVLAKASNTDKDVAWVNPSTGGTSLPTGGSTGQALVKNSNTNNDVKWASIDQELPDGGSSGQVLAKASSLNKDVAWVTPTTGDSLPVGGTIGQVLVKASNTDKDVAWSTISGGTGNGKMPATDPPDTTKKYVCVATYSASAWQYSWEEVI